MRVSLCLIARDEERFLPGCLASVAGVVDEMIVVDTGSQDRTLVLARQAGARVLKQPWTDDFSAPRNAAVAAATGDWILQLDADERLATGSASAIASFVRRADVDVGYLPLVNASHLGQTDEQVLRAPADVPTLLARLFRRTPDLRWRGRVHETPDAWLTGRRGRVATCPAPILHLGYVPDVARERGKDARNRRLLELQLADDPRPSDYAHLAELLVKTGELAEAERVCELGWPVVLAATDMPGALLILAVARAMVQMRTGRAPKALATIDQAQEQTGEHPSLEVIRGAAHELCAPICGPGRAEHLHAAGLACLRALKHHGTLFSTPVLPGATSWLARAHLARVNVQLGEYRLARAQAEQVAPHAPTAPIATLALRECDVALSDPDPSLDWPPADGDASFPHHRVLMGLRARAAADDARPIFVGGAGRSGTTLMRRLLGGLAALPVPRELDLAQLARGYPNARFVHMVRDGRAVAASAARCDGVDPVDAALEWATMQRRIRAGLPFALGRVLEVRYEQLVTQPDVHLERVSRFLERPIDAAGGPAMHAHAVDRWRDDLSPDQLARIEALIGDWLDDLDYARVTATPEVKTWPCPATR